MPGVGLSVRIVFFVFFFFFFCGGSGRYARSAVPLARDTVSALIPPSRPVLRSRALSGLGWTR
eukprot:5208169-Prymnesium_polylepis.1